jgi:hypothetical protein
MYTLHVQEDALAGLRGPRSESSGSTQPLLQLALAGLWVRLKEKPADQGESRDSERLRVAFGQGVAALYELDEERRLVRILRAWPFRQGR